MILFRSQGEYQIKNQHPCFQEIEGLVRVDSCLFNGTLIKNVKDTVLYFVLKDRKSCGFRGVFE